MRGHGVILEDIRSQNSAVMEALPATRAALVIDPRHDRAVVYRSLTDVRELRPDGVLDGEDILPGFRCALRDILS